VIVDAASIERFAAAKTIAIDVENETIQADDDAPVPFALDPPVSRSCSAAASSVLNGKIPRFVLEPSALRDAHRRPAG